MNKSYKVALGISSITFAAIFALYKIFTKPDVYVLIGDIGGTNIRLKLVSIEPGKNHPNKIFKQQQMLIQKYNSFGDILQAFLQDCKNNYPQIGIVAIAGPIHDNKIRMANVGRFGIIDGNILKQKFAFKKFQFINDFAAASYGLQIIQEQRLIRLNKVQFNSQKTKAVIGIGTGLGTAYVFPAPFRKRFRNYILPGQGGHVIFAPNNDLEREYYKFLTEIFNTQNFCSERVWGGPLIPFMFKFLKQKYPDLKSQLKDEQIQKDKYSLHNRKLSKQIIKKGVSQQDELCLQVVKMFTNMYFNAIGNIGLTNLTYGGIFLVGSLSNQLVPFILKDPQERMLVICLNQKEFKRDREYMREVIDKIPIVVVNDKQVGLKGAFVYARRIIFDQHMV